MLAETSLAFKIFGWIKRVFNSIFAFFKRFFTLESRITALEARFTKHPPDICDYCGEPAMRKTESSMIKGDRHGHWQEDMWACAACRKREKRVVRF
jgi:uncharacterized protein with PIN domain